MWFWDGLAKGEGGKPHTQVLMKHLQRAMVSQGGALLHAAIAHPVWGFNDPREWEDAGFRDLFVSPGLKLCEWPEKAHGFLPVPDLDIFIDVLNEHERAVRLQAHTTLGEGLLA